MLIDFYLQKINKVINTFIKTIDESYSARMGNDFVACLNESVIEWTLIYVGNGGQAFYDNFVTRYPTAKNLQLFTLSILHEIGHLETEDEMEDDIEIRKTNLSNKDYFNLFNERIATDWAGKWIENNLDTAITLDKTLYKIIFEFYKKCLTN